MKEEKEFLREKFIEFQLKIAELNHTLLKQKEASQAKEKGLFLNMFEVMDAFDNLDENIAEKEEGFDKTTRMLVRNVRSIRKKLLRVLKANNIVPIEFPDNMARMDYCKVVDTKDVSGMENEMIISVVKNGYIDKQQDIVLRKAEVITVLH